MQKPLVKFVEERKTKQNPFAVLQDIDRRNKENENLFTAEQHTRATEFLHKVQNAYIRSRVYKNNRKTFIGIKVDRPTMADKLSAEVEQLERYVREAKIPKTIMGPHIVYEIV